MHVLLKGESPHTALPALTQPSHRPFVISIVCPEVAALRMNLAVPEAPVVFVGFPPHCSIFPAIPPQIERRATLMSWSTRVLFAVNVWFQDGMEEKSHGFICACCAGDCSWIYSLCCRRPVHKAWKSHCSRHKGGDEQCELHFQIRLTVGFKRMIASSSYG